MILTYDDIINEVEKNKKNSELGINIEPFIKENVGPNSIDFTLSDHLVVYENYELDSKSINKTDTVQIDPINGYTIRPGRLYLASTNEKTYTPTHVPIFHGKSSLGRLGLFVHITAGLGDVGFSGNWTLELMCVQPIKLYAGMKIGQISFHQVSSKPTVDYRTTGRYNKQKKATPSKGV